MLTDNIRNASATIFEPDVWKAPSGASSYGPELFYNLTYAVESKKMPADNDEVALEKSDVTRQRYHSLHRWYKW